MATSALIELPTPCRRDVRPSSETSSSS